ncbi:MAG: VV A18-like helicase [Solivirus sp.]|uniref:VV A18-like helicase n=1 Tax=Solivirus sp. TaxID=2487772 RepID=A0A3G5AHX1_9VIRU|nr:MAG: VV A18-like helicase [Solivirus sp.]
MSVRIPISLLTPEIKLLINKECSLKEKVPKWQQQRFYKIPKEITFYEVIGAAEISIPMYVASQIFGQKMINSKRQLPKFTEFQMRVELYDYQKAVFSKAIEYYQEYGACFLNVFCSFGKTVVGAHASALFSKNYQMRTLVIFHRITIKRSWEGTFRNCTTANVYVVGETDGPILPTHNVILSMDERVQNIHPDILKTIGHTIIDEADCFCTQHRVSVLLATQPVFLTLLTATFSRPDTFERMLPMMCGPKRITRISTKPFFVLKVETDFQVEPREGKNGIIWDDLITKFDEIPERNNLIMQIVLDNLHRKIMIPFKHTEQCAKFHQWISYYINPHGLTCSLFYGNMETYDDANVLCTTVSKTGIGFDEKEACRNWQGRRFDFLLIPNSILSNEQLYGRGFRADLPVIIELHDQQKHVRSQFSRKKAWIQKRNGIILEIPKGERFCWENIKEKMITTYINKSEVIVGTEDGEDSESQIDSVSNFIPQNDEIGNSSDYLSSLLERTQK